MAEPTREAYSKPDDESPIDRSIAVGLAIFLAPDQSFQRADDIIAAATPVNRRPLGAAACVHVSALHQRRATHALFSDDRAKLRPALEIPAVCVDLMALVTIRVAGASFNEDGSEIGRASVRAANRYIRNESETNEVLVNRVTRAFATVYDLAFPAADFTGRNFRETSSPPAEKCDELAVVHDDPPSCVTSNRARIFPVKRRVFAVSRRHCNFVTRRNIDLRSFVSRFSSGIRER